ncbi:hypothetical protein C8Q74DRAFT_1221647 [Fomes fomentarius]|nr:hypothetical protein C8Q74DRAFT_1221647 [Fomes fomentarius]
MNSTTPSPLVTAQTLCVPTSSEATCTAKMMASQLNLAAKAYIDMAIIQLFQTLQSNGGSIKISTPDNFDGTKSHYNTWKEQANLYVGVWAAAYVVHLVMSAATLSASSILDRIPYHTSALSGHAWVLELLNGHPDHIKNELGMQKFQHANETISCNRYYREVLDALSSFPFYNTYVHLPPCNAPVPDHLYNNPKFYPYFKNVLVAVNGLHIQCTPSAADGQLAQDQKGQVMQNTLAVCGFDMVFYYIIQALLSAMPFLFPTGVFDITWLNGAELIILDRPPEFDMDVQARIPSALVAVHNFIWMYDPDELADFKDILEDQPNVDEFGDLASGPPTHTKQRWAEQTRDGVAEAMWADYIAYMKNIHILGKQVSKVQLLNVRQLCLKLLHACNGLGLMHRSCINPNRTC